MPSNHYRKVAIVAVAIIALSIGVFGLFLMGSRFAPAGNAATNRQQMLVTADFYPIAEFARQVGRGHVKVDTIVKAGMEPHDFEPLPRDIATVLQSKVFAYNGAGMDPWVDHLLPDLRQNKVTVIQASQGIHLLSASKMGGQAHGMNTDPHVWLDPVLAEHEVDNIAAGFMSADAAHRGEYAANAAAYKAKLSRLDADFRHGLAKCASRDIVTSHAAFGYLARRYGLNQVAIAGLTPDEEPSPRTLADIARFAQTHHVHYIFFESLVSPRLAQTIAKETGAKTLELNPIESLTDEELARGDDYLSVQRQNLQNLRLALECR